MEVALVTGASSGMGLIYAGMLAQKGYNILLVSNQRQELEDVASDIREKYGVSTIARYQDLAENDAARKLYDYCHVEGLEVEVLVNNAGMFFFKELCAEDLPRVEKMLSLHVLTVTELSLLFGEDMRRRGHGHILIVSSMTARLPAPGITVYSATKAYLKSFGKSLHFEMKPYGVGVTTVCPAAIATPLYGINPKLMDFFLKLGIIKTPEWLVRKALRAMFRRRSVTSPGLMNVYLPPMVRMLPERLEDHIWQKIKK